MLEETTPAASARKRPDSAQRFKPRWSFHLHSLFIGLSTSQPVVIFEDNPTNDPRPLYNVKDGLYCWRSNKFCRCPMTHIPTWQTTPRLPNVCPENVVIAYQRQLLTCKNAGENHWEISARPGRLSSASLPPHLNAGQRGFAPRAS